MPTPLGWAAARWSLGPRALRWASTAALLVSVLIVFTGGVVRVTGSGLGCPTWPTCNGTDVIVPVPDNLHLVIEQSNRMLTGLVIVVVAWVIVAARLQRPRDRRLTRLAWSQFWLVVANAVVGGFSVLAGLNPWVVAAHFIMAIGLLTTTTLTWHRVHERPIQRADADLGPVGSAGAWALVALTLVLVVVGTLVSGSGPHSGDSSDVPRMGFVWERVTWVHGVLGTLTLVAGVGLAVGIGDSARARRVRIRLVAFAVVVALQGAIGVVQALTGLPEWLVSLHLLGAALVWVGALRVLLDARPALFAGSAPADARGTPSPENAGAAL
ncbi:COX15/CtaA family protein [Galbitalea sp. SE-J8]|uniref:COX15/CtaA family protein n=1 Tax=Galbitalea sp. SE-J8 TaxID=3054952 RepID=UPI00259CEC59|nr:COX15/CtaA family protein [Galbitalea sp. SE-J8]MDM4763121.1 COX15/CtaA family protein [Galbitalea sp. SE-J8]